MAKLVAFKVQFLQIGQISNLLRELFQLVSFEIQIFQIDQSSDLLRESKAAAN